jgi:hypothetical protein
LQRKVDGFIASEEADATIDQKNNLKFHLSMLIVDELNRGPVKRPQQLRTIAVQDASLTDDQIALLFGKLKQWSSDYTTAEGMILERAAKTQGFSDYLLKRAAEDRTETQTAT